MIRLINKAAAATLGMLLITTAHAAISGWGIKIGSVDVHVDLRGVGNPKTKPTIVIVDGKLEEISYLCRNPTNHDVAPGSAADRTISGSDVVDAGNIVGKGQASVDLKFEVAGPFTCVNPNWTYIPHSEAAELVTIAIKWYACNGTGTDPCYNGNTYTIESVPNDVVTGMCSIHPVLRYPDGTYDQMGNNISYTTIPGQTYDCVETSP